MPAVSEVDATTGQDARPLDTSGQSSDSRSKSGTSRLRSKPRARKLRKRSNSSARAHVPEVTQEVWDAFRPDKDS